MNLEQLKAKRESKRQNCDKTVELPEYPGVVFNVLGMPAKEVIRYHSLIQETEDQDDPEVMIGFMVEMISKFLVIEDELVFDSESGREELTNLGMGSLMDAMSAINTPSQSGDDSKKK